MSNYPYILDTILTLPTVPGTGDGYIAINALQEAVIKIETELGIKPSTPYSDVRVRLDILESRINFGVSPSIPNDGYVKSPLYIMNVVDGYTLSISDGYGAPTENRLNGSLYMRADGYANNDFYIRRDGYWVPIQTEEWVAAGDLSGNHLSQKVIGIRTKPLDVSLESVGATQDGYHLTWDDADGYWRAETGFVAGSDLAADSPRFGRTGQKVIRIQNNSVSSTVPTNKQTFVWEAASNRWEPQEQAVLFGGSTVTSDGYTTRVNIRSNKIQQAASVNTSGFVGMVNFGTDTSGLAAGTANNYAAILSGNRHFATGNFGLIVGGDSHIASAQYSAVLDGYGNSASGQYAFVLDGYTNTAFGANSFVLGGGFSQANASYSSILNGTGHSIAVGNTHAAVMFGSSNTITGAVASYSVIVGGSLNTTNAQNVFLGTPSNANVQSNYGFIGTGINNTISTTSNHSAIISGTTNSIAAASGFSFIGAGNNISATGLYATVLNATVATVNGLHTTILNGNTNSITATFSTIGNGNNNIISGNPAYATILDGYSNNVTGSGGLIVDGYSNTVNGIWSSIINGNNNSISGRNSTVLNGSSNVLDAASSENTILVGTSNSHVNSSNTVVIGSGNSLTNVNSHFILGSFNTHQSTFSFTNGSLNTSTAGASFNRVWGSSNALNASTITAIFGNSNIIGPATTTSNNFIAGSSNIVDGYGNSAVLGSNNIAVASYSMVSGQYGKSRLFGQMVQANSRFTAGKIGEAQWSRVVLTGTSNSGAAIPLLLQDTAPTPATFQDGYSYDMQVRVLVVNTAPISPNPVVPARFVFDVLAHQESGTLVLDNINQTIITPNTSDDPTGATRTVGWSVSISTSGNQLTVTVDPELDATNYVRPSGTPSNRRAVATIEMREMSRL